MDFYLGTILAWPMDYAPQGWAICAGQTMQANQNQALFSLLGTNYGGDGRTTFKLPDLRGRFPIGMGSHGENTYMLGKCGGKETTILNPNNIPPHTHYISNIVNVNGGGDNIPISMDIKIPVNTDTYQNSPEYTNTPGSNCTLAEGKAGSFPTKIYTTNEPTEGANLKPFTAQTTVNVPAPNVQVSSACASQSTNNSPFFMMPPYQVINYIIALEGIYPARP